MSQSVDTSTLYETIFKRRAVRDYDMTPLDEETLAKIRAFINEIKLLDGYTVRFEIVPANLVSANKAPHYILCFSDGSPTELINIGFVFQKLICICKALDLEQFG
jgi:hypothetical protein